MQKSGYGSRKNGDREACEKKFLCQQCLDEISWISKSMGKRTGRSIIFGRRNTEA